MVAEFEHGIGEKMRRLQEMLAIAAGERDKITAEYDGSLAALKHDYQEQLREKRHEAQETARYHMARLRTHGAS